MEELAAICRIEPEDTSYDFGDLIAKTVLIDDNFSGAQVLEREKSGAYIVFVKHKPIPIDFSFNPLKGDGGYLISTEIREGKIKMTYLGTVKQIKNILDELEQHGPTYRIVSLTDAKFSLNSPLNSLTEKQRRVLTTAYKLGYYSLPRKINSQQLAKKLNLHKSALVTHRRKAELRLITQVLKEQ
jgi:predicted DNA binding protein